MKAVVSPQIHIGLPLGERTGAISREEYTEAQEVLREAGIPIGRYIVLLLKRDIPLLRKQLQEQFFAFSESVVKVERKKAKEKAKVRVDSFDGEEPPLPFNGKIKRVSKLKID